MSARPQPGREPDGGAESDPASRGIERSLQLQGRDFVFALHAGMRALKLYPLENQAVQNALRELESAAARIHEHGEGLVLQFVGNFCFVNDVRLRAELSTFAALGGVSRVFARHGIGQLEAAPAAAREEWTALLSLLQREPEAEDPEDAFAEFMEHLGRSPVRSLEVEPVASSEVEQRGPAQQQEVARRAYNQSVAAAREMMTGVRMGKAVSMRRVKRAVQSIVDQVLNNEASITGMTVLRDYDQYTFAHSVNVCIFSVALGKKLELKKQELYELGMGALLHDMGKVTMPIELTTKRGSLAEVEWELIREHPTEGMLKLLELRQSGDVPLRAVLAAYEHHMKIDLTGYPPCRREREPTLFSRIVAIADGFDAATTKRSYQATPWLPDDVLREMRDNPARGFDPMLVKAFVSMTGFYPVGTVVILDSYELAVVVERNPDEEAAAQPIVKIIYDEMGVPIPNPPLVNLAEKDPQSGEPKRTIIKTTDPEQYGIDVKDYFV